jgi:hypothetical protein
MHTYRDSVGNVVKGTMHEKFDDAISLLQHALKSTINKDFKTLYPQPNPSAIKTLMCSQFKSNRNTIKFDGGLKLQRCSRSLGVKNVVSVVIRVKIFLSTSPYHPSSSILTHPSNPTPSPLPAQLRSTHLSNALLTGHMGTQ